MKISGQNILKINEEELPLGMCGGREQMQQHDQNNGRGLGLVGYAMCVKIVDSGLYFIFSFHFILLFFSFSFSFFYF